VQSPPLELILDVSHLAARNLLHAGGPADGDTVSEITRALVARTPHGKTLLALGLAGASVAFWWHICRPLYR
jgi:hypothetical protein